MTKRKKKERERNKQGIIAQNKTTTSKTRLFASEGRAEELPRARI